MDLPPVTSGCNYIMGITSDDLKVWRRVSDGVEVKLSGWYPGDPVDKPGYTILKWYTKHDSSHNNEIFNWSDSDYVRVHFICEY